MKAMKGMVVKNVYVFFLGVGVHERACVLNFLRWSDFYTSVDR